MGSTTLKMTFVQSAIAASLLIGSFSLITAQPAQADITGGNTPLVLTTIPTQSTLPKAVEQAVKQAIQRQFGVPIANLTVTEFSAQNWPDGCLGLGNEEACTLAIVPGYRVSVSDGGQTWNYRTDQQGQSLRLEDADKARLPIAIAQKLLQRIAKDNRVNIATLQVTEVKSRVFGGCLGLVTYPPTACTKIGLPGWQVIVAGKSRNWVYHLTQDGNRIVKNSTASGAGSEVRTSFDYFGAEPAPLAAGVVFRSTISGGFTGEMQTLELTEDGKLTRYVSGPLIKTRPQVLTTLSPAALARFKQTLDRQRYANLNGITYLTSAAVADVPTTQFEAQGGSVQYLSLVQDQLPRSLQQIIRQWEALVPVAK
jgi:hypothetical protein